MKRPFSDCYWVLNESFLAGEYPGSRNDDQARKKLAALLDQGIQCFIDLTEKREPLRPYTLLLEELAVQRGGVICVKRFGVRDNSIPSRALTIEILDAIDGIVREGRPLYLHCWGGHGRTGTVVGCYLVRHGMKPSNALDHLRELRRCVPDSPPLSQEQRDFVLAWHE
jgi:protein-tyrosine phosphatase